MVNVEERWRVLSAFLLRLPVCSCVPLSVHAFHSVCNCFFHPLLFSYCPCVVLSVWWALSISVCFFLSVHPSVPSYTLIHPFVHVRPHAIHSCLSVHTLVRPSVRACPWRSLLYFSVSPAVTIFFLTPDDRYYCAAQLSAAPRSPACCCCTCPHLLPRASNTSIIL